jgi:amino acid adenylation domain-containing protein
MNFEKRKTRITGIFHGSLVLDSVKNKTVQLLTMHDVFSKAHLSAGSCADLDHKLFSVVADTLAAGAAQTEQKQSVIETSESAAEVLTLNLLSMSDTEHWFSLCAPAEIADLTTLNMCLQQLFLEHNQTETDDVVQFSEVSSWLQSIGDDPVKPVLTDFVGPARLDSYYKQRLNVGSYRCSDKNTLATATLSLAELHGKIVETSRLCEATASVVVGAAIRTVLKYFNPKAELAYMCSIRGDESLQSVYGPLFAVMPLNSNCTENFHETIKSEQQAFNDVSAVAECFYDVGGKTYRHLYNSFDNKLFPTVQIESMIHDCCNFDLSFQLLIENDVYKIITSYNAVLFDEKIISLLCSKIESVIRDDVLSHEPWAGSGTVTEYPFANLIAWSKFNLAQHPASLITEVSGARCSKAELHQRAGQLANYLRAQGVGSGSYVVLYLPRSIDYFVSILAVAWTGATYIPLDDTLPHGRVQQIVTQLNPIGIIAAGRLVQQIEHPLVIDVKTVQLQHYSAHLESPQIRPADVAYIIFTSGSTGEPKGIEISHGALMNHMTWFINSFSWGSDDVVLQKTNAGFDASVWEFWLVLLSGVNCAIADADASYDLDRFIQILAAHKVTTLQLVPSYLALLLEHPEFSQRLSINKLFCGGEALKTSIAGTAAEKLQAQVINLYGPSECCIDATSFVFKAGISSDFVPIGKPISNLKCVVWQENGQFAEAGMSGELLIAGPSVFNGYFKDEEKTRAAIYTDSAAQRYYRTGDLVQIMADGNLYFIGRIDNQVKLNGYRVDLNAIGSTAETLATVVRAECFFQEETRQLVLFYKATEALPELLIRQHLSVVLPAYMVPERYQQLDQFPLTSNGKVDARRLLKQLDDAVNSDHQPPATALEEAIAQVWQQVFKSARPVSVNDNFFSLGGDSILGIKVVYQLNKVGIDVVLMTLFENPTIRAMAQTISQVPAGSQPQAEPGIMQYEVPVALAAQYQDVYPATGMQSFILHQYDKDKNRLGVFHPQEVVWLDKSVFSYELLQQLLAIEMQHVNFRTRFAETSQGLFQLLLQHGTAEVLHLVADSEVQFQQMIKDTLKADNQRRFDWRNPQAALIRFYYIESPADTIAVIMSNLHTIQDGWGNVEFKNHLNARFQQTISCGADEILALPNVSKEFALQEMQLLKNKEITEFWQQQATTFSQGRWQYQDFGCTGVDTVQCRLPAALLSNTKRWAKLHGLHLKSVFLSALSLAVRTVLGDSKAAFAVVANGRNSALSDPLHAMGLFWNLLPLKLAAHDDVMALAKVTQQQLIALEPYSRYPFNRQIELNDGKMPVWCSFNYVDFHHRDYAQSAAEAKATGTAAVKELLGQDYFGFPLEFSVSVQDSRFEGFIQYNPEVVAPAEVADIMVHFSQQLENCVP